MAIELTPLGFQIPDGNEPVRGGDNVIAANGWKAQDLIKSTQDQVVANAAAAQATANSLATRLGQAEANIRGGLGDGPGLIEDPLNPGTYFMADTSPIQPDPDNTGLYLF